MNDGLFKNENLCGFRINVNITLVRNYYLWGKEQIKRQTKKINITFIK